MKAKLVFLFFSITLFVSAQNKAADSLIVLLDRCKSSICKAKLLNNIAEEYKNTNPKLMLEYANKALELSKK